jgi:hypothetical protein
MADRNGITQPQKGPAGFAGNARLIGVQNFPILAADLALNNTIQLFVAPKGFIVMGHYCSVSDMDTNGTPTVTFSIGDATTAARFLSASSIAQTGGTNTSMVASAIGFQFTADTNVAWLTAAAAATAAAGTLTYYLLGVQG